MFNAIKSKISEALALAAAVVEVLGAILEAIHGATAAIRDFEIPHTAPAEPSEDPRVDALVVRMDALTGAVAEGVQRVQRSENRIRSIVQGARRELADQGLEHPGVEAEAEQLRLLDGKDREPEQVPEVQEEVADDSQLPSSVPGVSVGDMRRMRGT